MTTQILATKLYIPPPRPNAVHRSRLVARLNEGLHRKLTLISAPAGFGKTTLVSEWAASSDRSATQVAWLSLDEEDSDPVRFLTYLITALRTIAPSVGEVALGVLQAPQPPPIESILTTLLNEITTIPNDFVLVLDDYHVIDARARVPGGSPGFLPRRGREEVDHAVAFLLEHLPPPMHLVITTREDPPLPLARLRARRELTELRVIDLRFTNAEAAAFLNEAMGLHLSAENIDALEDRTEGWIAGLQLAALSMQGHQDVSGFVRSFAGDHRYIVDYLVEEVLQRQPEGVRRFLLQTSILDRLNGSLCDAVTGQEEGKTRLEALERGNFFVVPLDDQRVWYRYHHLFADVLAAHLQAEQPDQVAPLHRRASAWYAQNDLLSEAIRHALAAADFAHAAALIERAVPAMRQNRQEGMMLGWLKALPDALVRVRPVLSAVYAGALLSSGEIAGVEARLRDAERWLDEKVAPADMRERPEPHAAAADGAAMVVVDAVAFQRLPGSIAVWRAGLALVRGDVAGTVQYARRALDLVPEDDQIGRGGATALLGLASWASGDLAAAYRAFAEGIALVQQTGYISDAINGAIALADIRMAQGRRTEARRIYEQALQLATAQGDPGLRGTADLYVGLSELAREQNDLPAATQHLLRSKELGERTGFPQNQSRWGVAMAHMRVIEGDLDGALDLLDEAERRYVSDFFPNVHPVAASRTRVWVAQGRLGEALAWAQERGLSVEDDLSYLREFEHLTLARVLLARQQIDPAERALLAALGLLARLRQAAEDGARSGSVLEILVLQAIAHQMQGDLPAALRSLQAALTRAEPEGYIRLFVDEGPPMAHLLEQAAHHGIAPHYVRQLRAALGQAAARPPGTQGLIAPLSGRERDVLRLLGTDLTGPEMARELMVSLPTLRTHTNNIYSKLGVTSRRAAVRRAQELDLV